MKTSTLGYFLFFGLFVFSGLQCQSQHVAWSKGAANRSFFDLQTDKEGNIYALVDSGKVPVLFLIKYSPAGNEIWRINETGYTSPKLLIDSQGSIYLYSSCSGQIQKYASDGNLIWQRKYLQSCSSPNHISSLVLDKTENLLFQYPDTTSNYTSPIRFYTAKLTKDNQQLWLKRGSGTNAIIAPDNSYYNIYSFDSMTGTSRYSIAFLKRYDASGNEIDSKFLGSFDETGQDEWSNSFSSFIFDKNNTLYFVLHNSSVIYATVYDVCDDFQYVTNRDALISYEPNQKSWSILPYDQSLGYCYHLFFDLSGHFQYRVSPQEALIPDTCTQIPSFFSMNEAHLNFPDGHVHLFNKFGQLLFNDTINGLQKYFQYTKSAIDPFGNLIFCLYSNNDALIKIERDACPTVAAPEPYQFDDFRAFPNPFTNVVRFHCIPDGDSTAHLTVYDLLGRKIEDSYHLQNENGDATFFWQPPANLQRQTYLCRIITSKRTFTTTIVKD